MWGMVKNSFGQFMRGKLFAEPGKVYRQLFIGVLLTALITIGVVAAGAPLWAGALIGSFVGGALQPYLFKDLRYR